MAKKISEKSPKTPDKKVRTSHLEEAQTKIQEQIDQLRTDVDALKQGQADLNAKIGKPATTPVQDAAKKAFDGAMSSGGTPAE